MYLCFGETFQLTSDEIECDNPNNYFDLSYNSDQFQVQDRNIDSVELFLS